MPNKFSYNDFFTQCTGYTIEFDIINARQTKINKKRPKLLSVQFEKREETGRRQGHAATLSSLSDYNIMYVVKWASATVV